MRPLVAFAKKSNFQDIILGFTNRFRGLATVVFPNILQKKVHQDFSSVKMATLSEEDIKRISEDWFKALEVLQKEGCKESGEFIESLSFEDSLTIKTEIGDQDKLDLIAASLASRLGKRLTKNSETKPVILSGYDQNRKSVSPHADFMGKGVSLLTIACSSGLGKARTNVFSSKSILDELLKRSIDPAPLFESIFMDEDYPDEGIFPIFYLGSNGKVNINFNFGVKVAYLGDSQDRLKKHFEALNELRVMLGGDRLEPEPGLFKTLLNSILKPPEDKYKELLKGESYYLKYGEIAFIYNLWNLHSRDQTSTMVKYIDIDGMEKELNRPIDPKRVVKVSSYEDAIFPSSYVSKGSSNKLKEQSLENILQ